MLRFRLQRWPKIPRRGFWVTQYDALAEHLVLHRTIFEITEIDCRVLTCVFGLELQFRNGTARWLGKRVYSFETAHRNTAFRLLTKLWRTHGLLPFSAETADYRNKLATAATNLEEAIVGTADCVCQVAVQIRALLEACPPLLSEPDRMLERRRYPRQIVLKPAGVVDLRPTQTFPWPKGY